MLIRILFLSLSLSAREFPIHRKIRRRDTFAMTNFVTSPCAKIVPFGLPSRLVKSSAESETGLSGVPFVNDLNLKDVDRETAAGYKLRPSSAINHQASPTSANTNLRCSLLNRDGVSAPRMENGIDAMPDKLRNDARSFRDWTLMYREKRSCLARVFF